MRYIATIFWIIIIVLAVIFAILNSHYVQVHFYFRSFNIYLPLLLLIDLAIGSLLGIIAIFPSVVRAKNNARKLQQKIKQAELEVKNLRAIPIKDSH